MHAPERCPTGQAPKLRLRLPRHCCGCRGYAPPLNCVWPAWSEEFEARLLVNLVTCQGYLPADAQVVMDRIRECSPYVP